MQNMVNQKLAILGGPAVFTSKKYDENLFHWPIFTDEDEQAVLKVFREGRMSQIQDETKEFEKQYAKWAGTRYALTHCNGTMALLTAMWAAGVTRGTELICPSVTYWASAAQALSLGASVVFADIDRETLCIDPDDIEHRITPATKAIVVVHYCGHPCDMDPICAISEKHNLRIIEDVSHAHGTLYKGRMAGTFGDVAGLSMMTGKSFPLGEGGMLITNNREIYERAIAFAHYERHGELTMPDLGKNVGIPLGGVKGRINQACSAMGLVQLKYYPQRIAEIQKAMNYFWDLLKNTPGIRPHRPHKASGSTMGGWYHPMGLYYPEELGGLPVDKYIQAVEAETFMPCRSINKPLHEFAFFNSADIYKDGRPTNCSLASKSSKHLYDEMPVASGISHLTFGIPPFKKYMPKIIEKYAEAYKKVALQADKLLNI